MKKICVIGHFGFGKELLNGQTIKTKIITNELQNQLGKQEVSMIDIAGGKKKLLKLFFKTGAAMKKNKNIVIMPVENGLMFFTPVLTFWNLIFHRSLQYIVIGGWLPKFISDKKWLQCMLKAFDHIEVETNTMKKALEKMGFQNVSVMPNCKELKILTEDELVYQYNKPLPICTFSRVMKEKGIEDIIRVVKEINEERNSIEFSLDIYGQIDRGYVERFEKIKKEFPLYINYKGEVPYSKSVGVLKNYYALVFPTNFFTEGIPGTIIDAYAAGIPVISSRWESFSDVVDEGIVGKGFEFGYPHELKKILQGLADAPEELLKMKLSCIKKAENFTVQKVVSDFAGGRAYAKPLKLCTFSRVMKQKGIEDAIDAVRTINEAAGKILYTLDIYGQVDEEYKETFQLLCSKFPDYIAYRGCVPFGESSKVLKDYYALVFPTYYEGEGFAGTLIDALAAGVPVVASDWKYNSEIVIEEVTGRTYDYKDKKKFIEILQKIAKENTMWNRMKHQCIRQAERYTPSVVVGDYVKKLR